MEGENPVYDLEAPEYCDAFFLRVELFGNAAQNGW
jgi:hypothetical protein